MKTQFDRPGRRCVALLALALPAMINLHLSTLHAQGTVFTYQGRLNDGGQPANGTNYGMVFYLYDMPTNGTLLGNQGIASVTVSNGLFTVPLNFGSVFDGNPRWLEITVQINGGSSTTLNPRQQLTPAPYAIMAGSASNLLGTLPVTQLSGAVSLANLPTMLLVTNGQSGVNLTGTFSGNGAGVTNLDLSLNSGGAITLGNFILTSSPGVGTGPLSVVAADVNGDGKMDLISANYGSGTGNTLTVLTNNGSGGFALASSPGVGTGPYSVTAADVNGDAKVDLISANFFPDTLSVLTNNGSGSFALASSPGVGNGPISVAAVDVNGDAKVDLISANFSANTLTVLTNNGSGGFALASLLSVGSGPSSVTAADANGDGKVDLISANSGANTLTVLTNNGSGSFALSSSPGVGNGPSSVAASDVNGDRKVDLISANSGTNTLTVLTNNGSGGFVLSSSPGVGLRPTSVTAADVTGDGKVDLISANNGLNAGNTLTVLINNGSGGFVLSSSVGVGNAPRWVTAADVNGDGRMDLISANQVANTLSVLFNTATFRGGFLEIVTAGEGIRVRGQSSGVANSAYVSFVNGAGTGIGYVGDGSTQDDSIYLGAYIGNVHLYTSSGAALTATAAGNVGIRRTPVSNALEVEGNASKTVAGSWLANSDARIKTDVRTVTGALDKLSQVRLVQFHYTDDYRAQHPSLKDRSYLNVVAQEFQKVFPEHVQSSGEKLPGSDDAILQVDTYPLTIYSAAAIQELNGKLEAGNQKSEARVQKLESENAELKQRLEQLEGLMNQNNRGAK
jgi:hypothetical protein